MFISGYFLRKSSEFLLSNICSAVLKSIIFLSPSSSTEAAIYSLLFAQFLISGISFALPPVSAFQVWDVLHWNASQIIAADLLNNLAEMLFKAS